MRISEGSSDVCSSDLGVELTEDAVELPSFYHPQAAAYVLGRERGSLSPALQDRCDYLVKIPTKFCINVATAGAIVMYDRLVSQGRFPRRALNPRAAPQPLPLHVQGLQKVRRKQDGRSEEHTSELQSLMRISYAV